MVTFSPPAYTELLSRVSRCTEPQPGVVVAWHEAQVDHIRSKNGQPVWKEVEPAHWDVVVMSLSELKVEEAQLEQVGELKVYFLPQKSPGPGVKVDFANGRFHVRSDAA